ncbi:hypothetical protein THRCLA_00890 [Thraustotheca clavata]|uniref:Uncharacterized protein n=1 Tax=Thraustotheca clavata TaxID=74557 RepID=A0A1W0A9W6_9STRA|nr:hypothetical protein THRCLA_00890 [Thraustotheca clavata]
MSFFGLTFLGSQGPFSNTTPIHAFDESDFLNAFNDITKGGTELAPSQFNAFVHCLYRCPKEEQAPKDIVEQLHAWFPDATMPKSQFLAGMDALAVASEESSENQCDTWSKGCEYKSGLDLRADKFKHTRMKNGPKEKYSEPLTDTQTLGWIKGTITKTIPKKSCEETKYASAMIQSGVCYY